MSAIAFFVCGMIINTYYPRPCAKLPIFVSNQECKPVFLFALSFMTFEKISSVCDGTRIRGVFRTQETFTTTRFLRDFPLLKFCS